MKAHFLAIGLAVLTLCSISEVVHATPVTAAAEIVKEAEAILASAEKAKKSDDKKKLVVRGLTKLSRAYLLLVTNKLTGSAPQLFEKIEKEIARLSERQEVVDARSTLQQAAIVAAAGGKMVDAYDKFSALRSLDPRDKNVQYVLEVLGRRMDAK